MVPLGLRWYAVALIFLALNVALPYWMAFTVWGFVILIGWAGHRLGWQVPAVKAALALAILFAATTTFFELVGAAVREGRMAQEPAVTEAVGWASMLALAGSLACMGEACGMAPSSRRAESMRRG